ncbi:aminotransferase class I/II-fold pyridoxal phosphate-dependent enzyme [Solibacillus sp. FSL W8-0372]|uniref:pyridoxal phosphate-dependent aminotransferase n=1 Tax=Solibacillus sp. FSL W8-0372 TaxID=2921713 RepID=UPI0030CEC7DB
MQLPAHGANAAVLYKAMNLKMPDQVIDVSENVNHLGVPKLVEQQWPNLLEKITGYPDEQAEPFRSQAADVHEVAAQHVVVTNGAAEGLMALAQLFKGYEVALLQPSFSEYARTLKQQNCVIHSILADDIETYRFNEEILEKQLKDVHACYICNPNNPTGVLMKKNWIEQLVKKYPHCNFVVDEAFMDWTDESESVIPLVNSYPNLFVVRSMTKMYALAGIRLGYVIGQQAEEIRHYLPHWNVSAIANEIGCLCLQDKDIVKESREKSSRLRSQMVVDLKLISCKVSNSAANFLLFQLPKQYNPDDFFTYLLERGIVLRHTKNYVGLDGAWFRIAVKSEEIWTKCKDEIMDYVKNY